MISVKNAEQLKLMRRAGRITGEALMLAGEAIKPGMTTKQLDTLIRRYIEKCGAKPTFLGYGGFPGSACISINEQVIHGIPSANKVMEEGDIVKVDVGAFIGGYTGDAANTFPVGKIDAEAQRLIDVTKESFWKGIANAKPGNRVGDIGYAIQSYVEENGFSVVRKYVGHGVGRELHESPDVPNFGTKGRGVRLCSGMTIAVEPMVNAGGYEVRELNDKWTVVTADKSLSAHYEHSIAITDEGVMVLTKVD